MTFLEALTEHLESITERDIDRFAATLASGDVTFVGAGGELTEGRENVIAAHRDWFMDETWRFDPEIVHTREDGGAAFALARVTYSDENGSKMMWLSLLFVDEGGEWRCAFDQSTAIQA